jgi:hypothetical protein
VGNRDDQRIVASSFHALVDGNRASVAELSRRTGIRQRSVERSVRRLVASGRVSMAEGKVVAAAGLSLVPTSHQLRLGRRWFYAWSLLAGADAMRDVWAGVGGPDQERLATTGSA